MISSLRPGLLMLLLAFCGAANAQKFKVNFSENAKMRYEFDDAAMLDNGQYIVLKSEPKGGGMFSGRISWKTSLTLINSDMSVNTEKDLEVDDKKSDVGGFEKIKGKIFYIYNSYDSKSKTTSVNAMRIDEKTLSPLSKTILGSFESDNRFDQARPSFMFSNDSSKILLFVEGPERKKENKKFFIGVYDTDLKFVWNKEVELPIGERYVSIYDQDVTNDGKVFVSIKHYDKEVSRESVREDGSKIPSYVYKLLVFSKESATPKEINFNLNNNFIQGTKLAYNNNGSITVAGLYKRKHNGNINGAFYALIDPNSSNVNSPKMVDFPEDLVRLVDKDKFGSDKEKDPGLYRNFRIRQILKRTNGSVDLLSEYYRVDMVTVSRPNGGSTTYYRYISGDIVNTNIGADGKAIFTRVPKRQEMTNSTLFIGYAPIVYNDKLVLLYNDDEDNITRDLEKAPDDVLKFNKSVFAAATIDAKGNLTRQAIYSHRDEDYVFVPRSTAKISDSKYLITADLFKLFKKRTRYGVLEIQ